MDKYEKKNLSNFLESVNKDLDKRESGRWVVACLDDIPHKYGRTIHLKLLDRKTNMQAAREFEWRSYRCVIDHKNNIKDYKIEPDIWNWIVWFIAKCEGYKVMQEYSKPMRDRYYRKKEQKEKGKENETGGQ